MFVPILEVLAHALLDLLLLGLWQGSIAWCGVCGKATCLLLGGWEKESGSGWGLQMPFEYISRDLTSSY